MSNTAAKILPFKVEVPACKNCKYMRKDRAMRLFSITGTFLPIPYLWLDRWGLFIPLLIACWMLARAASKDSLKFSHCSSPKTEKANEELEIRAREARVALGLPPKDIKEKNISNYCSTERMFDFLCGPTGAFFEERK